MHDLVGGRAAWTVLGLPTQGQVGDRRRVGPLSLPVTSVSISSTIADVQALGPIRHAIAVLSPENVLLGALDSLSVGLHPTTPVHEVMVAAPGTIRPDVRIDDALRQLTQNGLAYTFVTTARGVIVGIIDVTQTHV